MLTGADAGVPTGVHADASGAGAGASNGLARGTTEVTVAAENNHQ